MLAPVSVLVLTDQPLPPQKEQALRQHAKAHLLTLATSPEQLLEDLKSRLPQPEPELIELQDEVTKELQQVEELLIEQQNELRLFRSKDAVLNRRSILVVGRDRGNVYTLTNVLQEKGAQVLFAENGPDVMQQLESHPGTDLVLMENILPEMDGCKVTREIRRQNRFAKLPIIALMVSAKGDEYQRCLDAGANDYLLKPVDTDELLSLLRVWLY
jgi:CheY-like chemotaxis protein